MRDTELGAEVPLLHGSDCWNHRVPNGSIEFPKQRHTNRLIEFTRLYGYVCDLF